MASGYGSDQRQISLDAKISRLATRQHGVFSRTQALRCGATDSSIRTRIVAGRWEWLHPGVYRVAGLPQSWRQLLLAACLAWGDGALASHRSAARLWRFPGFEHAPLEITVPRIRRGRNAALIVHWSDVPPNDATVLETIPVTSPFRTLLDLASLASIEVVEEALDDALRRRLASISRLRWHLGESAGRGRRGIVVLRSLLDARDRSNDVPQSVFETKLLRTLKKAGLPEPVLQHPVRIGKNIIAVVDFAFPALRLAIEADGYRWHSGRVRSEHDRARRNSLTALGWRVVHVTWTDLASDPDAVVHMIEHAARDARGTFGRG
ncbi:MAG: DUF559 domain-containing protein [Actinomycetota bacterium]